MTIGLDRAGLDAAERLFFGGSVEIGRKPRQSGRALLASAEVRSTSSPVGMQAIRAKLNGLERRVPEVMVKITGAARSMSHVRAHLAYITRKGSEQIPLEDQAGSHHSGADGLRDVREDWQSGFPVPEEQAVVPGAGEDGAALQKGRREAFHLVLSMPAGTPEVALKRAVRDFARAEFDGHQYVMAFHTPSTDPDPKPSPQPHVHLTVKARSLAGVRLNPRKADLQRWREQFTKCLGENGIEAVATKRATRMQRVPGRHQKVRQLVGRGGELSRSQRRIPAADAVARNEATRLQVAEDWIAVLGSLDRSESDEDRRLARRLAVQIGLEVPKPGRALSSRKGRADSPGDKGEREL